jgi:hypothetical protein
MGLAVIASGEPTGKPRGRNEFRFPPKIFPSAAEVRAHRIKLRPTLPSDNTIRVRVADITPAGTAEARRDGLAPQS